MSGFLVGQNLKKNARFSAQVKTVVLNDLDTNSGETPEECKLVA